MRAVIGDILGKTRLIDIWNDETSFRVGGNSENEADRATGIGSLTILPDHCVCSLHNNGYVSFIDTEAKERTSYLNLELGLSDSAKSYSVSFQQDHYIGLFNTKCVTFNNESKISEFQTVDSSSCGIISGNDLIIGRTNDRTVIFDVSSGKQKWIAADPPLDELKLVVPDDDISLVSIEPSVFVVGQTGGIALLYDIRAGQNAIIRAPIFKEANNEYIPIAISLALLDTNKFIAGSSIGGLHVVDIRSNSEENQIFAGSQGFTGSPAGIISIARHPSAQIFAALSLDRVIRMYDFSKNTKLPMKASFVRTMSTCLSLFDDSLPQEKDPTEELWDSLEENKDNIWENYTPCPQSKMVIHTNDKNE